MEIEEARYVVRKHLVESLRQIKEGDSVGSDAETEQAMSILRRWDVEDRLAELLSPLMDEGERPFVRYNAASYLLSQGYFARAIPVLEEVSSGNGLAALGAERVLTEWRSQRRDDAHDQS